MAFRNKLSPPQLLASYDPHPHQVAFHQDGHKYRALVSGVGAGKTRMGCEEVMKWTQLYPGSLGVIGRLTAKSLRETTQRRFFEVFPAAIIEEYNKSEEHVWVKTPVFDRGAPLYSELLFFHLDDPGPLGSLDISYFWIDEAHEPDGGEVPEPTFEMLTARLRHPVGPHRGFVTSNSGGKDYIWDKFFNPAKRAQFSEYIGWTVGTEANKKYLPPGYVEELRRTKSDIWVSRFLDASFEAFEGQIFTDFDDTIHTFKPGEIELSSAWDHGVGFDFGVGAPTAAVYGCVDRDGIIYMYDEDYQADADIDIFAHGIKNRGFDSVQADPSVVARGAGKKSPKQLYQEQGVILIPASNDVDYFLTLTRQLLRGRTSKGGPLIRFSTKCKHLIEQIKQAAWDPKAITGTTHDKIKKSEDHALDAFKYWLNSYGLNPGVLNPVVPGKTVTKQLAQGENWEHESYAEDEDFDSEDYLFPKLKRGVV